MNDPAIEELLPEHRDRVWRDGSSGLRVWSWDEGRQQWLDESRGEADQWAWSDHPRSISGFVEYVPASSG